MNQDRITSTADVARGVRKAGKAAFSFAKAAGKAASGNYIGAAKDIVANETTRKLVAGILVFVIVFPLLCTAALPATIFGGVEGFISSAGNDLLSESAYAGDRITDVENDIPLYMEKADSNYRKNENINEVYTFSLSNIIKSIFKFFTSGRLDSGQEELSNLLSRDLYHTVAYDNAAGQSAETSAQTLQAYVDATASRYEKRKEQYQDMLSDIVMELWRDPPLMVYGYDDYRIESEFHSPEPTTGDMLYAISTYSVQRGANSLYNLNSKSLISWLGTFYSGDRRDDGYMFYDGSRTREFRTVKWDGDCLPQYAYEELQLQQQEIEKKGLDPDSLPDHKSQSFAFVPASYIVDKTTGITYKTRVEYYWALVFGRYVLCTRLIFTVVMNAEFLAPMSKLTPQTYAASPEYIGFANGMPNDADNEIASKVIGFWSGSFDKGGVPGDGKADDVNFNARSWEGLDGKTYERQYDYQVQYVSDLQGMALKYLQDNNIAGITTWRNNNDGSQYQSYSGSVYYNYGDLTFKNGVTEVTYFNQYDTRFKSGRVNSKGTDLFSGYACGPTSMSIVISSLTGRVVTPTEIGNWASTRGYWSLGNAAMRQIVPGAARNWGLTCTSYTRNLNPQILIDALSSGKLVVAIMGPGTFTSSGHYIVLRGVTETGKILVADPASNSRTKTGEYDISLIIREVSKSEQATGPFWVIENQNTTYTDVAQELPSEDTRDNMQMQGADFVRVRDYCENILVELRYATTNNFTGQKIYSFNDAYLRYSAVQKLIEAESIVENKGYRLKIWDAYRPVSAQQKLFDAYPIDEYVADPSKHPSSHNYGTCVDITLVDMDGRAVEMPTDFDDFSSAARLDYSGCSDAAKEHRSILLNAMEQAGFTRYNSEWWHYADRSVSYAVANFEPPTRTTSR